MSNTLDILDGIHIANYKYIQSAGTKILIPQLQKSTHELHFFSSLGFLLYPKRRRKHHLHIYHKHDCSVVPESAKLFPVIVPSLTIWERGANDEARRSEKQQGAKQTH